MLQTMYARTYQQVMRSAMYALPWRKPMLLTGENSVHKLPRVLTEHGVTHLLIVTDEGMMQSGLLQPLLQQLHDEQIRYTLYTKTEPNPTIAQVEEAYALYNEARCDSLLAFGGGSPIDCAKGVGARVANPTKSIARMKGILKVKKPLPLLIAVPTTAGTGSEVTLAAVLSNRETREKYALKDPALIPHIAVLDPLLTKNLPPHLTATTGMDALTHAIESYIGYSNTAETKRCAEEAVKLVFTYLPRAYKNGHDLEARSYMQYASYLAGVAFTRAYVGNVHAISHALSALYNTPHGLANAVLLPHVLTHYGEHAQKRLAQLATLVHIDGHTAAQKAANLIEAIIEMNEAMNIPRQLPNIQQQDIPQMIKRAQREANPLYPVPKIFTHHDFEEIYKAIQLN